MSLEQPNGQRFVLIDNESNANMVPTEVWSAYLYHALSTIFILFGVANKLIIQNASIILY